MGSRFNSGSGRVPNIGRLPAIVPNKIGPFEKFLEETGWRHVDFGESDGWGNNLRKYKWVKSIYSSPLGFLPSAVFTYRAEISWEKSIKVPQGNIMAEAIKYVTITMSFLAADDFRSTGQSFRECMEFIRTDLSSYQCSVTSEKDFVLSEIGDILDGCMVFSIHDL